jgi:O-antigen ligase
MAAVLVAVRVLGPYIASRRRDQLPFVLFAAACGIVLTALTVIEGRDIITILLGRDSTLSGRTEHWAVLLPYMLQHLWLGYGYEAFWLGNGDSLHVITRIGGAMKGADSGYVDTMLSLGLLGLAALFIVALARVYDFVRLIRNASVPLIAYWYAGLILATFVGMFTESSFLLSPARDYKA